MPLLINDDDVVSIDIWYEEKDILKISDKEEVGWNKETFKFKRPNWGTLSQIMAVSLVVLQSGKVTINPIVYADAKIRNLLSEWTLKDRDGKKVSINAESISKLHPDICSFLSDRMDRYIALNNITPDQQVDSVVKE